MREELETIAADMIAAGIPRWSGALRALAAKCGEPVLWVHPMMLNTGALGVECSPMQFGPAQIPLYTAPPAPVVGVPSYNEERETIAAQHLDDIVKWLRERGLYEDGDYATEGPDFAAILSSHEDEMFRTPAPSVDRDAEDAARYRWMRENGAAVDPDTLHWRRNKWLDNAIDAARAAERGE